MNPIFKALFSHSLEVTIVRFEGTDSIQFKVKSTPPFPILYADEDNTVLKVDTARGHAEDWLRLQGFRGSVNLLTKSGVKVIQIGE